MIDFDPAKHKIVAVEVATGQHFHVTLPDLVREIEDVQAVATVVRQEMPAEVQALLLDMADRLVKLKRAVHDLEHRLDPIERTMKTLAAEAAKRVAA